MKHTTLGRTDIQISRLGYGCMGLAEFYGDASSQAAVDAVLDAALALGVDFFDTADMYGTGLNEKQISPFVRRNRDRVVLATKFGVVRGDQPANRSIDNRPEYIRKACDASLGRLGVDHIDLYYMHRRDPEVPIEDAVGAMSRLVEAGKVRAIGLSEVNADTLRKAHATHPISALQSELSLTTQDVAREMLPVCRELGVTFVAYSPLGRGLLSGTWTPDADLDASDFRAHLPRFKGEALEKNLEPVELLRDIAARHDVTPAALALAWVLDQGDDVVPIPGTRKAERVRENARALDVELTDDDRRRLTNAFGGIIGERYPAMGMKSVGR